jgi:hypothetical protein
MDLNAITIGSIDTAPRARSVSLECRQQYRADGLCVRCGLPGHWVKDCKLRPYVSNTGKVTIAAIDDDAYDESLDSDDPDHPDAWQKGIFHT